MSTKPNNGPIDLRSVRTPVETNGATVGTDALADLSLTDEARAMIAVDMYKFDAQMRLQLLAMLNRTSLNDDVKALMNWVNTMRPKLAFGPAPVVDQADDTSDDETA